MPRQNKVNKRHFATRRRLSRPLGVSIRYLEWRLILIVLAILFTGYLLISTVFASDVRPKGLEDKGPLTKITFIHYKKGFAKPVSTKPKGGTSCYDFFASGAKWKIAEDYLVNPTDSGLDTLFVLQTMASGTAEWEKYGGSNIFGSGYFDPSVIYDTSRVDGKNVVTFGFYSDPSVIAVTTVWGYFSGPPRTREIVEWDMLFSNNYTWGDASVNPSVMDLLNIATHELGHSAGMGDLYNTVCGQETMYGYSDYGEIMKRDLGAGDIKGIQTLYSN